MNEITPNMEEYHAERLQKFSSEPIATGRIIFLGDSITEGANWTERLPHLAPINRGIAGDITQGVLDRLDDITMRRPLKLFIMIGINDIGKDVPVAAIVNNYRKIIDQIQSESPQTQILVQSILPVNPDCPDFPPAYDRLDLVIEANRLLGEVAAGKGCPYLNLFDLFLDDQERLDARYTYDGLHLNEAGYLHWLTYLEDNGFLLQIAPSPTSSL